MAASDSSPASDSGGSDNAPSGGREGRRRQRVLVPCLAAMCGAVSVANFAIQHRAAHGGDTGADQTRTAREALRSSFLSASGTVARGSGFGVGGGVVGRTMGGGSGGGGEREGGLREKSSEGRPRGEVGGVSTSEQEPAADGDAVKEEDDPQQHVLAGLSCGRYGGPHDEASVEEMVFWSDVPSDSRYRSPWFGKGAGEGGTREKYLTFEPDHGGWNNIRMAMETVLVMSHAMGRTLVLPPEKQMYLLNKDRGKHKTSFSFNDFFHLDSIAVEHDGLDVITMEEFLRRAGAREGRLADRGTGKALTPPGGRIEWDGASNLDPLWRYLRYVGRVPPGWNPDGCVLGIPATSDPEDAERLRRDHADVMKDGKPPDWMDFKGRPTPVDAPPVDRLREMMGNREGLCLYDAEMQAEPHIHLRVSHGDGDRMLTHFYAFLFFQDWRQDLFYKRFVRDHVRYVDEIVCAAARIVKAARGRAREAGGDPDGVYDSMHVRRGDFQYKKTRIGAEELYERSKGELTQGATLYIATDERDKSFFAPIREHYNVLFLDDFKEQLGDINTNYYGMLDQLVASKGRVFYGTWWSTLSGYINRMRGYYLTKHQLEGYEDGTMQSYYFIPDDRKLEMRQYMSVRLPIYMREFPTSWRDIDRGIEDLHRSAAAAADAPAAGGSDPSVQQR